MTAAVLGAAWGVLALSVATRWRPAPSRVRALRPPGHRGPHRSPLVTVGALVWRAAGRPCPPGQARRTGAVVLATAAVLTVSPALAPVPGLAAWVAWRREAARARRTRLRRLEADLPQAVDLLRLAVGAGLNVSLAVAAAGRRGTGPVAAELRRVAGEAARGRRLADALDELPARAGEALRPLSSALANCERYGVALGPTLERISDDVRRQSRRRAEEAARKVPVALLFPLVLCILPAFALLTVAPLIAGALGELRL